MTKETTPAPARAFSLKLLAGYLLLAAAASSWRLARGDGSLVVIAAYLLLLGAVAAVSRGGGRGAAFLGDWLPLIALPVLYAALPATIVHGDGRVFDATIQGWDRSLFGTDPARTFAGAMPLTALSELLHAAYLSYYLIIYGPPLWMYLRGDTNAFSRTVLAFTMAMTACFAVFCVFPVEGPRYAWPPPAGVPDGPFRSMTLALLEGGSSRGTAFPSSHQAIALAIGLSSLRWSRWWGGGLTAVAGLLGAGAVYGGFHYATDMVVGAAVGAGAFWATGRVAERRNAAPA